MTLTKFQSFLTTKTMKIQEFIEKNLNTVQHKIKRCSSVYVDQHGIFYSYGSHYPLLIPINGKYFVNDAGYSNSTAKHINWAHAATAYEALVYNYTYGDNGLTVLTDAKSIKACVRNELKEVQQQLATMRKGAFRKQANLEYRQEQLQASLNNL